MVDENSEAFDSAEDWSMVNMSSRALSKAFLVFSISEDVRINLATFLASLL